MRPPITRSAVEQRASTAPPGFSQRQTLLSESDLFASFAVWTGLSHGVSHGFEALRSALASMHSITGLLLYQQIVRVVMNTHGLYRIKVEKR